MESVIKDLERKYIEKSIRVTLNVFKAVGIVSEGLEEERRKAKICEGLAEKVVACHAQLASLETEDVRLLERKKKLQQRNGELNELLKKELKKAEDQQAAINEERARIEEHNRISKKINDRASLLLRPYQEYMGVEFQIAHQPELSLRLLFTVPSGKKCMVKLTKKDLKIVKCVPMLDDLPALQARLKETNDFAGFVTRLRTLFLQSLIGKKSSD